MSKKEIWGYILIGIVLMAWLYFTSPSTQEVQNVAKKEQKISQQVPANKIKDSILSDKKTIINDQKDETISSVPEKIINAENNVMRVEFTSKGARVKKIFLKQYDNWYYDKKNANSAKYYEKEVQLVRYTKNGGELSLTFDTKKGERINTAYLDFTSNNKPNNVILNAENSSIEFIYNFGNGSSLIKRFTISKDKYVINCDFEFVNMESFVQKENGYLVSWNNGINFVEHSSFDEARYSNSSVYQGGEQVIYDCDKSKQYFEKNLNGKVDWVAVRNKYFSVIFAPNKPKDDDNVALKGWHKSIGIDGERETYSVDYKTSFTGNSYQKDSYSLYVGPVDYNILKAENKHYEKLVDFGNLFGIRFIIRPLSEYIFLPLLKMLHYLIPNYGIVILIFALFIKALLTPFTSVTLKSQKKMQLLQPQINEIRSKFEDPQKQQQETMKLYSHYGVNPMGGCLPLLLQMPILVALWSLFNVAVDLRHQPFMLWIQNLSAPDVIISLPSKLPLIGVDQISGLALLLGITMFLQQKNQITDPNQKAMIYMMPVMMTLMFMSFPSGLNLYYFMFNIYSIVEQKLYNKFKTDIILAPVKSKKKGWMQKMMEQAEKQQQMQKQMKNTKK